ncbi:MAG: flippase [Pseudomonadota bacterium]
MKPSGFLSNSAWLIFERVFVSLIALAVLPIVARYLGPSDFGLLSYALSLGTLFAIAGHLGLDGLIVRELVSKEQEPAVILGTVFRMKLVAYWLAAAALALYAFAAAPTGSNEFWLIICAAAFVAVAPFSLLKNWFHALVRAKFVVWSVVISALISAASKLLMVAYGVSVIFIGAMTAAEAALVAVILYLFYRKQEGLPLSDWKFSGATAKRLLSESWMVFAGSIFATIYLRIDQVMLRWISGADEVGTYAVAAKLSEVTYFVPAAIVASLFPGLIKLRKDDEGEFRNRLQAVFDLLAFMGLGVLVASLIVGPWAISLLFGEAYTPSISVFLIQVFALPFIFMRYAFSRWILIEKLARFSLITQGAGALINVGLNLVLIPQFGGIGAGYATVFSYAAASFAMLLFSSKTRPLFFMMTRALVMPWRGAAQCLAIAFNRREALHV